MERSSSFGTSWADQWDYSNPDPVSEKKGGGNGKKNGAVKKTKEAASTGIKKGINWIKDKCHKNKGDDKH